MTYVFIRSWHLVRSWEPPRTRCGRWFDVDREAVDVLPDEKSCETCLRWVAREVEEQVTG